MPNESEQNIRESISILEATKGYRIPRRVGEIPGFPYSNFDSLLRGFAANELRLHRMPFVGYVNQTIFEMLATPAERFRSTAYGSLLFLIPIASFALMYFVSWWFLLAVLLVPFPLSQTKKLYYKIIFREAFQSELIFCFLYYGGQVAVSTADNEKTYCWDDATDQSFKGKVNEQKE